MKMTTTQSEEITTTTYREIHRANVEQYLELSLFAASGYPGPLTDDQKAAYQTLPFLMDECKEAWDRLPVDARPVHYLLGPA
jgi:hypothetical protein